MPPEPPPSHPPLGKAFYITLLAPVASIVIAAILPALDRSADRGLGLWFLTIPVMCICAIVCAVWIGRRQGATLGILLFFGILISYGAVALAGCQAIVPKIH